MAGYSNVEQLAAAVGVSASSVQRWETNQVEPSLNSLVKISDATGRPLEWFFEDQAA